MADYHVLALPGETRAAVLEGFALVEMHMLRDGDGLQAGARVPARLKTRMGSRGIAETDGEALLVEPWPAGAGEGATVTLEVTRAAWRERGRDRLAKARPTQLQPWPAPGLDARLAARGLVRKPGWPPEVADAWAEGFGSAELGRMAFLQGSLTFAPTPAFTAVDVDGHGLSLVGPGLLALARAIRLWGLGGGIVVDLPAADRAQRQQAVEGFDAAMAGLAFERTAINGFGLLQIVRPRIGPSILERALLDRAGTAAVALLEAAGRTGGAGPLRLVAAPEVIRWIEDRPQLIADVARAAGRAVDLRRDPGAGTGHVEPAG